MKKNFVSTYQGTAATPYNTPHGERNILAAWIFFLHYMQYIRLLSHEASRVALYDRCLEHAPHPVADVATDASTAFSCSSTKSEGRTDTK